MRSVVAGAVAFLFLFGVATAHAEKHIALVIGNGDYQNTGKLRNPRNDAQDVAVALERIGFEVILRLDLDKPGMDQAALQFARVAPTADVALFYYSGHAMEFGGQNFLMPVDAKLSDEHDLRWMFRADDVVSVLKRAKALQILVLDACRDNPLAEELKRSISTTRSVAPSRGLARIDEESSKGMIISFATQPGQVADDGAGRNSPYTAAFLRHIGANEDVTDIFRKIMGDVSETTRNKQRPQLSTSYPGKYYFQGPPANASPAPPKQAKPEAGKCSPLEADLAYADAIRKRTSQALRAFVMQCPDDQRVASVRAIELQSADDEMWESVAKEDKMVGYGQYLISFPNGLHVDEARQRVKLKKQAALLPPVEQPQVQPAPMSSTPAPRLENPAPQVPLIYHHEVDFNGNDLDPAQPVLFNHSLESCEAACRARAACRAFTFNHQKEACFLKSGTGRQKRDKRATSAVVERIAPTATAPGPALTGGGRILPGRDFEGGNLYDLRSVTLEQCVLSCARESQCRGFSYVELKNWCFLKRELSEPKPNAAVISGMKH